MSVSVGFLPVPGLIILDLISPDTTASAGGLARSAGALGSAMTLNSSTSNTRSPAGAPGRAGVLP